MISDRRRGKIIRLIDYAGIQTSLAITRKRARMRGLASTIIKEYHRIILWDGYM